MINFIDFYIVISQIKLEYFKRFYKNLNLNNEYRSISGLFRPISYRHLKSGAKFSHKKINSLKSRNEDIKFFTSI